MRVKLTNRGDAPTTIDWSLADDATDRRTDTIEPGEDLRITVKDGDHLRLAYAGDIDREDSE